MAEAQARIDSHEYSEWVAYTALVGPLGPEREDWQLAQIVAAIANANRDAKKRPQAYKVEDFMLSQHAAEASENMDDDTDEEARAAALERKILGAFGSWIKAD